jgi:predicted DsbA family dithiol-disulfide isomerase
VTVLLVYGCKGDNPFIGNADNYLAAKDTSPEPKWCPESPRRLFNNSNSPSRWGDEQTGVEVNIVEDLRCPYCIAFSLDIRDLWQRRLDFQKSVRLYFHHFPIEELHPGITEIHVACAAAANQGAQYFWAVYDKIVRRHELGDPMGIEEVESFLAVQSGFDNVRFRADLKAEKAKDFVQWDMRQADRAGVNGTPAVFVCAEKLARRDTLESRIDELLDDQAAQ